MKLFSKIRSQANGDAGLQESPVQSDLKKELRGNSAVMTGKRPKKLFSRFAATIGKWSKKKKITVAVCAAVIIAAAVCLKIFVFHGGGTESVYYTTAAVAKRDISVTLSGSGTLQPAKSYDITSKTTGEILSDNFKEGDKVTEGQVLYTIDTADAEADVKSATLSLAEAKLKYEDAVESQGNLNVKAPCGGTITSLNVKVGDSVSSGQVIGTIRDSSVLSLVIPFNSADAASFYVGETAKVTVDGTFETLSGKITKINNAEQVLTGNMLVKYVTIDINNPGGLTASTSATAKVGDVACNSSAQLTYKSEGNITAKASGDVTSISVGEGNSVGKGGVVLTLNNSSLSQNIPSAELSVQEAQKTLDEKQEILDDCTVKAPIAGTIAEKTYAAGDTLGSGSTGSTSGSTLGSSSSGTSSGSSSSSSSGTVLCTIYDLSYMSLQMSVDELDISNVKTGQEVEITSDAVENTTYSGAVTSVGIEGTTSGGVTTYPVTVRIDKTDGLRPGMNVDAKIIVQSSGNALAVPVSAVVRGNTVLVQSTGKSAAGEVLKAGSRGLPDGFKYVKVTLGVSDDDYIAVTDGLSEGDIIAVKTVSGNTGNSSSNKNGMGLSIGGSTGRSSGGWSSSGRSSGGWSGRSSGGEMPSGGGAPSGGGMGG